VVVLKRGSACGSDTHREGVMVVIAGGGNEGDDPFLSPPPFALVSV